VSERTKILYIAGLGRSGSTLFDRMLGQIPGFFSVGELREIWHRGLQQNALCGCGLQFRACPFWTKVGERAFGGWDTVDAEAVQNLATSVDKHRWVPFLARPGLWGRFDRRVNRYLEYLRPVYQAIQEVGDTRVIIDSSKAPSSALVVLRMAELDVRILHLVRDSRGVAYSWTKTIVRPDIVGETVYVNRFHPVRIGSRWLTRNAMAELLSRRPPRGVRVQYEQMVRQPRAEIERVMAAIDEPVGPEDLAFVRGDEVILNPNHTVMGNPARMRDGLTALRLDEEWRTNLPPRQSGIVTALTWPLLRRYGYR
jgi:sulfotransferase family protein